MCQKYQKIYDQIIERARGRKLDCYSEWHHILPRALGGSNESFNLVQLTYREHFLVHWLLTKIVVGRGRRAMIYALQCMGTMDSSGQRFISSWQYDVARRTIQVHFENVRLKKMDLDRKNLEIYYQQIGLCGAKVDSIRTNCSSWKTNL